MAELDYLDFELEIGPGKGRDYPLAVLYSPAGETRATLHFPFDELALERYADKLQIALLRFVGRRRSAPSEEEHTVQEFGKTLFDALLTGEVRSRYDVSLERAIQQGKGLRLKLRITPPELAALPWEFLYDPRRAEYVCLSARTPIIRYLELPQSVEPLLVKPPLRILGMIASPRGVNKLDVVSEKTRLERALAGLKRRNLVELVWLEGSTWRHLYQALQQGSWHVFHFIGHGRYDIDSDEGQLLLCDQDDDRYALGATRLARLLADHPPLRLAVLNACEGARGGQHDIFSSTAATLVRRGLPAVLAMQYALTDRAAIEMAQYFYEALANGLPVDAAVVEARKAVSLALEGSLDWGAPVYFTRAPDGRIFELKGTPAPRPAAAPVLDTDLEKRLQRAYLEGSSAYWTRDWETARRYFQEVTELRPDYKDASTRLAEIEQQIEITGLYDQAQGAIQERDWRVAETALGKLAAKSPGYKDVDHLLVEARKQGQLADLYADARQLCEGKRWQAVISVFERIRALQADFPDEEDLFACAERGLAEEKIAREVEALHQQALGAMEAGKWDQAVEGLERLLEMDADYPNAAGLLERARAEQEAGLVARQPGEALGKRRLPVWVWGVAGLVALVVFYGLAVGRGGLSSLFSRELITDDYGVPMALIPAGSFQMGSEDGDADQRPVHAVNLGTFYIDIYEVTNAQFTECIEAGKCDPPGCDYFEKAEYADHPVVCVTWSQAQAFCEWRGARLPGEAEWEKAARGGLEGAKYPWGDDAPVCQDGAPNGARFDDNDRCGGIGTAQIGSYSPNGFGLYDMAGNVSEWVLDWYLATYYAGSPSENPPGPQSGEVRVVRGGSWNYSEWALRSAYRHWYYPEDRYGNLGFRCARSP